MEDSAAILGGRPVAEAAGISGTAFTASVSHQTQWEIKTSGHSHYDGPGDASPLRIGTGAHRGEPRRPNSYGFRPYRSTHDAIEQLVICLSRRCSGVWILEGDIKACFDEIGHQWLLEHVPMDREVLRQWLQAGYRGKGATLSHASGYAARRSRFPAAGQLDFGRIGSDGQKLVRVVGPRSTSSATRMTLWWWPRPRKYWSSR